MIYQQGQTADINHTKPDPVVQTNSPTPNSSHWLNQCCYVPVEPLKQTVLVVLFSGVNVTEITHLTFNLRCNLISVSCNCVFL